MPVTDSEGHVHKTCLIAGAFIDEYGDSMRVYCQIWIAAENPTASPPQKITSDAKVDIVFGNRSFPLQLTTGPVLEHDLTDVYFAKFPIQRSDKATLSIVWNQWKLSGSVECVNTFQYSPWVGKTRSTAYQYTDSVFQLTFNVLPAIPSSKWTVKLYEIHNHTYGWNNYEFTIPGCTYAMHESATERPSFSIPVWDRIMANTPDSMWVTFKYENVTYRTFKDVLGFHDPNMRHPGNLYGLEPVFSYHLFNMHGDGYGIIQYRSYSYFKLKTH